MKQASNFDKRRQIIREIRAEGDVVYITQHGRPTAVLVDFDQFEAMRAQLEEFNIKPSPHSPSATTKADSVVPSRLLPSLNDLPDRPD